MNDQHVRRERPTLCVINFNGAAVLPDTLAAAAAERDSFAEVIVVDNASEDGSVALIERDFAWMRIVRMPANGGPAIARNAGLRAVGTNLVLFIDNDVGLAKGCVDHLLHALGDNPRAAVAAPRVLYAHDRARIQYDGADNHFLGMMVLHNQDRLLADAEQTVRSVGGVVTACFLVDRRRLPDGDPFDETFFIYAEDHDFGLRIRTLGLEILSVPSAICYHGEGTKGLSLRSLGRYSKFRVFCQIRNRWQLLLKNYSLRSFLLFSPLLVVFEAGQFLIAVKRGWILEWARAFGWIIVHLPKILGRRRSVQRSRKLPDSALLVGGPVPFNSQFASDGVERLARKAFDRIVILYWKGARRLI